MDELFTMKSESPLNYTKKRNNVQIISTLRSETDSDYSEKNKNIKLQKNGNSIRTVVENTLPTSNSSSSVLYTEYNGNKGSINIENLQEDIVNIAESLNNLVKMFDEQREKFDEQREKINSIQNEVSRIYEIENEINKINKNVNNIADVKNDEKNNIYYDKRREIKQDLSTMSTTDTISTENVSINSESDFKNKVNNPKMFMNKKIEPYNSFKCKSKSKQSFTNSSKNKCTSESYQDYSCNYDNSKELEEKLNNITKGFNDELLDIKRKQALLTASYIKFSKR